MSIHRLDKQRGATAVLLAASALLLFAVVAIAIDIGAGFSERRQAQTAADFGSLSALQFAVSCNPCSVAAAVDAGAAEAIAVANANLPNQALDWAACTDPNRPASFIHISSTSQCVSFTGNLSRSRVVVPTASVETTFGAVLGADEVRVSAVAEAGLVEGAVSNILPFAAGPGSSMCLFSNQAPQTVPPCDGPENGAFGYLDIFLYGSDVPGTPDNCNVFNSNKRLAINTAVGTDHLLAIYDPADGEINDHAACPNKLEEPNQLEIQAGSPTSGITDGLLDGTTSPNFTGRLICSGAPCDTVRGWSIDDTPLWNFLVDGDSGSGGMQCTADITIDVVDRASMDACLQAWSPGGPIMFTEAIGAHPRFAAVPEFATYPTASSPPSDRNIVNFAPVYLETIYMRCNANTCTTVHSPGEPGSPPASCSNPLLATETQCGFGGSNPSDSIEGLTAFSIELEMLPVATRKLIPGSTTVREFLLIK